MQHPIRRPTFGALALVVALALVAGCGEPAAPYPYSGTIEFRDVSVGSLVGGRVIAVPAAEGETVAAGDVLVKLDAREWQSSLDEARALAEASRRELDLLLAGPRDEEIAQARAEAKRQELLYRVTADGARPEDVAAAREEVKAAEARLHEAQRNADRIISLVRGSAESDTALDSAIAARDTARAQLGVAEQRVLLLERGLRPDEIEAARQAWLAQAERVKALESGARPEEIAARRATIEAAEARIRVAESKLAELEITAPDACIVQTLDARPGDLLRPGAAVAVLLLPAEPWIVVYVPERDLARVALGQAARVVPDGHEPLDGTVSWISRQAEFTPRNVQTRAERVTQVFAVKIVLHGDASRLKDGMWADVDLR